MKFVAAIYEPSQLADRLFEGLRQAGHQVEVINCVGLAGEGNQHEPTFFLDGVRGSEPKGAWGLILVNPRGKDAQLRRDYAVALGKTTAMLEDSGEADPVFHKSCYHSHRWDDLLGQILKDVFVSTSDEITSTMIAPFLHEQEREWFDRHFPDGFSPGRDWSLQTQLSLIREGHARLLGRATESGAVPLFSMAEQRFEGVNWTNVLLSDADLEGAIFSQGRMSNVSLSRASCDRMRVFDTEWVGTSFRRASLRNAEFKNTKLVTCGFREASLEEARFVDVVLDRVDFRDAELREARFEGGSYHRLICQATDLTEVSAVGVDFAGIYLSRGLLARAQMRHAKLDSGHLGLVQAQFADLHSASLAQVYAKQANFSGAMLSQASLHNGYFCGADFSNANLRGANLSGAQLQFADLSGADLRDAQLESANLCGANLSGTNLLGCKARWANLNARAVTDTIVDPAVAAHLRVASRSEILAEATGENIDINF